jgi:uncharacterized protein YjbI with pentapeptide repeats
MASVKTKSPWEQAANEKRFAKHRVVIGGKLERLRKDDLLKVLKAEGATIDDKLGANTTLFIYSSAGSVDHKRAEKMKADGADILIASEDEFRRRYILATAEQAFQMLTSVPKGASRLANLLELNRDEFSNSTDEDSTIPLKKRSLKGARITNASLCGIKFIECDLTGADLTKSEWIEGASKSDFRKATIKQSNILESGSCDFRDCQLQGTSLRDMKECRFDGSDLTKGNGGGDLKKCSFGGAKLDNVDMSYADLKECSFEKASMQKSKFEDVTVDNCSFAGADLRNSLLKGDSDPIVFKNCNFKNADLRGASLSHVRFDKCDLTGAQFDGAKMAQVDFVKTDTSKAKGLVASAGSNGKKEKKGAAYEALEAATPTFKNITVKVMLKKGSKSIECLLYQFDHSANTSCRQAWLAGDDVGSLTIADAISTIAKLNPGLKLDDKSLSVKSSKGKKAPSLKPKALETAVRNAWIEALS